MWWNVTAYCTANPKLTPVDSHLLEKLVNFNIDIIGKVENIFRFDLLRWKREVTTLNALFLLLLVEVCAALFLPVSVTHYLLLCLEKECPKALTLCFHPWFGQSQALCQLSRHTIACCPALTLPKPLQPLPRPPSLPFMAGMHSAVTKWLSP